METQPFPFSAKQALLSTYVPRYRKVLDVLYSELVRFNTNVFILERIVSFPFHLFGFPDGDIFFSMSALNAIENCVLVAHKLLRDSDSESYSLRHFRNDVVRHIKRQYRDQFRAHLKQHGLAHQAETLLERVEALRNNRIAHLNRRMTFRGKVAVNVTVNEIVKVRDGLNRLFCALGFDVQFMLLPISYDPSVRQPIGTDLRPDVDRVLDAVARDSHLIGLAESNPQEWAATREIMKPKDLSELNKYRLRFGLAAV